MWRGGERRRSSCPSSSFPSSSSSTRPSEMLPFLSFHTRLARSLSVFQRPRFFRFSCCCFHQLFFFYRFSASSHVIRCVHATRHALTHTRTERERRRPCRPRRKCTRFEYLNLKKGGQRKSAESAEVFHPSSPRLGPLPCSFLLRKNQVKNREGGLGWNTNNKRSHQTHSALIK